MNKFARNHRPAELYAFQGGKATMAEIAKVKGMSVSSVWRRIDRGEDLDAPKAKTGRKPKTFTFTSEELGALIGLKAGSVLRRNSRGQELLSKARYEMVKDVTEQQKRKRTSDADVIKHREEIVRGLKERASDPESHETLETLLVAAYNAGAARSADT